MKLNKKAFTVVELVIVIAIIAILAAVLIPTFANMINKANVAKDTQLIRNLNTALASSRASNNNEKHKTLYDALQAADAFGYDIGKINASATNAEILWDQENDVFCYLEGTNIVYLPELVQSLERLSLSIKPYHLWKIFNDKDTFIGTGKNPYGFSIYWNGSALTETVNISGVGFDAGTSRVSKIIYSNNDNKNVVIRTNGGSLTVGSSEAVASGKIIHYGTLDEAIIYTTNSSFHTHGSIGKMELKKGTAVAEQNGIVYLVEANAEGVDVVENGGIFVIPSGVSTESVSTTIATKIGYTTTESNYDNATISGDKTYEIGSLADLEAFRDLVNGGFNFKGLTVKLTADITLNDGWIPIGEGSRDVALSSYVGSYLPGQDGKGSSFAGTFDGNNKTISNLNNKGYVPSLFSVDGTESGNTLTNTYEVFVYGFFGIVNNATIKNLTFDNVNIDFSEDISVPEATTNQKIAKADSVGALAGYSAGNLTVSRVIVNGSIKALDAVGGVVGRAYGIKNDNHNNVSISYCTNNAEITATGEKAAGILGYIAKHSLEASISNNTNTGKISSKKFVAGIVTIYNELTIDLQNNTNSGDLYAEQYTSGNNVDHCAVAYIAIGMTQNIIKLTSSNNTNTGKAYLNNKTQETSKVCLTHPIENAGTELTLYPSQN